MSIHQIYATHCTYGSSAVERRKGEFADRVMGYSARASSLSQEELRKVYRTFERFVYYHLPSDFPAEQKPHLSPYDAPRRLIYCPSVSGFQLVGQVGYRQWDVVQKRAGSYFGHLLVQPRGNGQEENGRAWSVLECLRSWQAPGWRMEDDVELGHDLPQWSELSALHAVAAGPQPALIGDELFLSFLTAPAGASFAAADEIIPPRWRHMPPEKRRDTFHQALCGYLQVAPSKRESLLLVVEPSIAVLLFYGIARLMPPGELREEISFSTFEANADRLVTTLAAVTFHNEERGDVSPQRYQRGFVLNTFLEKSSSSRLRDATFPDLALHMLLTGGFAAADRMLAAFAAAGAEKIEDLTEFARAETTAQEILDPAAAIADRSWRQSPRKVNYLQKSLRGFMEQSPPKVSLLNGLLASPDHLLAVLELIAHDGAAGHCENAARHLAKELPGDLYGKFVAAELIAPRFKIDGLTAFVLKHEALPPDCAGLWTHAAPPPVAGQKTVAPLPSQLLGRLPAPLCGKLWEAIPSNDEKSRRGFLVSLLEVAAGDEEKLSLAADIIRETSEPHLAELLKEHAPRLKAIPVAGRYPLGNRLLDLLRLLPEEPPEFTRRLSLLKSGRELLPASPEYRSMLGSWLDFDRQLRQFAEQRESASQAHGGKRAAKRKTVDQNHVGEELCKAARDGFAMDRFDLGEERARSEKASVVRALIEELGGADLIPSDFHFKAKEYFYGLRWPKSEVRIGGGKGFGLLDAKLIIAGVVAVVFIAAVVILLNNMQAGGGGEDDGSSARDGEESKSGLTDASSQEGATSGGAKDNNAKENDPKEDGSKGRKPKNDDAKSKDPANGGGKNNREGATEGDTPASAGPDSSGTNGEPKENDPPDETGKVAEEATSEPFDADSPNKPPAIASNQGTKPTPNQETEVRPKDGVDPPAPAILPEVAVYAEPPWTTVEPGEEKEKILSRDVNSPYQIHVHGSAALLDPTSANGGAPNQRISVEVRPNNNRTEIVLFAIAGPPNERKASAPRQGEHKIGSFYFDGKKLMCRVDWKKAGEFPSEIQRRLPLCVVELRPLGMGQPRYVSLIKPFKRCRLDKPTARVGDESGEEVLLETTKEFRADSDKPPIEAYAELFLGEQGKLLDGDQPVYSFGRAAAIRPPVNVQRFTEQINSLPGCELRVSTRRQAKNERNEPDLRMVLTLQLVLPSKLPELISQRDATKKRLDLLLKDLDAIEVNPSDDAGKQAQQEAWRRLAEEVDMASQKDLRLVKVAAQGLADSLRTAAESHNEALHRAQPDPLKLQGVREQINWVEADVYRIVPGNEGQQIRVLVTGGGAR